MERSYSLFIDPASAGDHSEAKKLVNSEPMENREAERKLAKAKYEAHIRRMTNHSYDNIDNTAYQEVIGLEGVADNHRQGFKELRN